jgi:hypothetical protein
VTTGIIDPPISSKNILLYGQSKHQFVAGRNNYTYYKARQTHKAIILYMAAKENSL